MCGAVAVPSAGVGAVQLHVTEETEDRNKLLPMSTRNPISTHQSMEGSYHHSPCWSHPRSDDTHHKALHIHTHAHGCTTTPQPQYPASTPTHVCKTNTSKRTTRTSTHTNRHISRPLCCQCMWVGTRGRHLHSQYQPHSDSVTHACMHNRTGTASHCNICRSHCNQLQSVLLLKE